MASDKTMMVRNPVSPVRKPGARSRMKTPTPARATSASNPAFEPSRTSFILEAHCGSSQSLSAVLRRKLDNPLTTSLSHGSTQGRIRSKSLQHRRKLRHISRRYHITIPHIANQIRRTACRIRNHDWQAAGHCLIDYQTPRVAPGGKDEGVRERIVSRQLLAVHESRPVDVPRLDRDSALQ